MERLTKRITAMGQEHYEVYHAGKYLFGGAIDRLGELENKLESGSLFELPCQIGDTVYGVGFITCAEGQTDDEKREIDEYCKKHTDCETCKYWRPDIQEFVVTEIQISKEWILILGDNGATFPVGEIFADKAKAEVRLSELKREPA